MTKTYPMNNKRSYEIIDSSGKVIETFRNIRTAKEMLKELEKLNPFEDYFLKDVRWD